MKLNDKPTLIIINGHPGTGKSSIGKGLSKELGIPFISKDVIKEKIFDNVGYSDKTWSRKVSGAAHRIMDYFVTEELAAGHSLIVESNFKPEHDAERFRKIKEKYHCRVIQILVRADGQIIYERYMNRMNGPNRHPGHVEELQDEELRKTFMIPYTPLDIEGELIEIDTSDFANVDIDKIAEKITA